MTFEANRQDGNLTAALGPACNQISRALRALGLLNRQAEQGHDLGRAVTRAVSALARIRLDGCCVEPRSLKRGERISITYRITSENPEPVTVWLGADCWPHYNIDEDIEVSVEPGTHEFQRSLTVADDWSVGGHELGIGVWAGPKSIPEESLRLAKKVPAATIEVA